MYAWQVESHRSPVHTTCGSGLLEDPTLRISTHPPHVP